MLSALIKALHDGSAKLILEKAYIPLLGEASTRLLMHLCNSLENGYRNIVHDGKGWHKQSLEWMSHHTQIPYNSLRRARDVLVEVGLVEVCQSNRCDRTTLWRVCDDVFLRFAAFAHARFPATRPTNGETLPAYLEWCKQNPTIYDEFKHLCPDEDQQLIEAVQAPKMGSSICPKSQFVDKNNSEQRTEPTPLETTALSSDDFAIYLDSIKRTKEPSTPLDARTHIPEKPKRQTRPDKYVEHWNQQPHVPKCAIGTKSYEKARDFFRAHRHYRAGELDFGVDKEERKRLQLHKLNRVPANPKYDGARNPVRPDSEMLEHIELAALVFHPDFAPVNKKVLPRSLPHFLYNPFSKRGASSIFLEKLLCNPPAPSENASVENLLDGADEQELEALEYVKRVYYLTNGRSPEQDLNLAELKEALSIVRNILRRHAEIPVERVPIFARHFGDFRWFLEWWENYMEDQVQNWAGMPITALNTNKDLWRRFVDFVSEDISYHLFTGERV